MWRTISWSMEIQQCRLCIAMWRGGSLPSWSSFKSFWGFCLNQDNAERDTWRQDLTLTTRGRPLLDVPWSLKMLRMTSTVGSTRGADPKIWLENFGPSRMWQVFLLVIFGTPCGDIRLGGMLGPYVEMISYIMKLASVSIVSHVI